MWTGGKLSVLAKAVLSGELEVCVGVFFILMRILLYIQRACEMYKLDPHLDKSDGAGFAPAYSKENYRVQTNSEPAKSKDVCNGMF